MGILVFLEERVDKNLGAHTIRAASVMVGVSGRGGGYFNIMQKPQIQRGGF